MKIFFLSAFAMITLSAVVSASVSAPVAPRAISEAFSPSSVTPVNPNLPIESYIAI